MTPCVIAIGLDSAEPALVEQWADAGYLPTIARLRSEGAYCRLRNPGWYRAEQAWTTVLTGCDPAQTGYRRSLQFDDSTYQVRNVLASDDRVFPPFYALGPEYRVAVLDIPHTAFSDRVEGIQVLGWGARSAGAPTASRPAPLIGELIQTYGRHPALNRDHASFWNPLAMWWLKQALETGIQRRAAMCRDLLRRRRWDLFFTVFSEIHSAGHFFWHQADKRHPLHKAGGRASGDPMLRVLRSVDRAVGEILDAAPRDASVVLFSPEGIQPNHMDLPNLVFLPEILFRFNFPGEVGLADGRRSSRIPLPIVRPKSLAWHRDLYARRADRNPLRRRLRRGLPIELTHVWERAADPGRGPGYPHRFGSLFYQPAVWYSHLWPTMKCFALPSFSDGSIRVNLEGREGRGVVPPAQYGRICDDVHGLLMLLRDARTGSPLVKDVIRTRRDAHDRDPTLPDADLIVIWNDVVTDVVEHPRIGRIGPVPYGRTGGHSDDGFAIVRAPGFAARSILPEARLIDVAPTILALLDSPRRGDLQGAPFGSTTRPSA